MSYGASLESVLSSLAKHGFVKFFVVNGHGGNTSANDITCRAWRESHPGHQVGHGGYFEFIDPALFSEMRGPWKTIRHACEAETSLMLHLRPDLVRWDKAIDDGLRPEPPVRGMVWRFDETTERGVLGAATLATPELGRALFESAVDGLAAQVAALAEGIALIGQ
jgi:creatinine amidohydrolase